MTMAPERDYHLDFLCRYITEKAGFKFDERKRQQLEEIVKERCQALRLDHMGDYNALLSAHVDKGKEFSTLMDILTIQESFFFRHKAQFDILQRFCLPQLIKKKGKEECINIWSAGCANGEEAYSIAMLVRDLIPERPEARVFIRGTDISQKALCSAKEGVYTERALRGLGPCYLNRYFSKQGEYYLLSKEIKGMVDFECLNLAEDPFPTVAMPIWDLIFCRNVIIYFTPEHQRKLIRSFYSVHAEGGYLFAGYSETMRYLHEDFVPIEMEGAFIYQKPFPGQEPHRPVGYVQEASKGRCVPLDLKKRDDVFNRTKVRPSSFTADNGPISLPKAKSYRTYSEPPEIEEPGFPGPGETAADESLDLDARLSLAAQLADKGETVNAVTLLDDVIRRDPLHAQSYFMLAMIYRNAGGLDQAAHYLKKVIYLEPQNPLARLHLADVFKEVSQKESAAREYANVISLLENRGDLEKEVYGDGFTGEAILAAARGHLESIDSNEYN
jgi:chemotaxis protein methyltransferase CheR